MHIDLLTRPSRRVAGKQAIATTSMVTAAAGVLGALAVVGSLGHGDVARFSYVACLAGAAGLVLSVAQRHATQRRVWLLVGAGLTSWTIAGALVTLQIGAFESIPSLVVSILYAAGYPLVLAGLVVLGTPPDVPRRLGAVLDGLIAFSLLYGAVWVLAVQPVSTDSRLPRVDRAFSALYPAFDVALLITTMWLLISKTVWRRVGVLLALGVLLGGAADVALLVLYLRDPAGAWPSTDLVYLLGNASIAVAAMISPAAGPSDRQTPEASGRRLSALVSLAGVGAAATLLALAVDGRSVRLAPLAGWLVVVAGLNVARSVVGMRSMERTRQQLDWYMTHDRLTGLLERTAFMNAGERGGVRERSGTVLYIDVDGSRSLSERYGPDHVDRVMVEVASRLRRALSEHATLARLSHDEFAAFVRSSDLGKGRSLAEAVRDETCVSMMIGDLEVPVSVSIGVAQTDGTVIDLEIGMRRARQAMRHAKSKGPGGIAVDAELAGNPDVADDERGARPVGATARYSPAALGF